MSRDKERKILDRITSHQLIILENPPQTPIEEIKILSLMTSKLEDSKASVSRTN